jgi:hypothetical protein
MQPSSFQMKEARAESQGCLVHRQIESELDSIEEFLGPLLPA